MVLLGSHYESSLCLGGIKEWGNQVIAKTRGCSQPLLNYISCVGVPQREEVELCYSNIPPEDLSGLQKWRLVSCWRYMSIAVPLQPGPEVSSFVGQADGAAHNSTVHVVGEGERRWLTML